MSIDMALRLRGLGGSARRSAFFSQASRYDIGSRGNAISSSSNLLCRPAGGLTFVVILNIGGKLHYVNTLRQARTFRPRNS